MNKVNTPLTDDDILAEVRYQSSQASGSEFASDELTESRKNALRYYLGRSRGDEVAGRSNVISKDVADMIDAMLTQIMPMFMTDDLAQFEATSQQDESQARLESAFCNYTIMEENNGFILFETLLKDALLSKNALVKVSVDTKISVDKEVYEGLSPEEVLMIGQPNQGNQEVDISRYDEETGTLELKRTTTKKKIVIDAVAPENFSITSEWKSQYLDECTYCVERSWMTKSDMIESGVDPKIVMDLPVSTSDTKIDSIERNQINDEQNFFNTSPSMQIVEVEEHYIRIDQDGDGIAELHKVITVENNLISNEEVDMIPYANGVAFLMGHRFYGLSVYDKLKDVQDMKTHFLRQWSDNALVHNHKKYLVVEEDTNMDDLLNGRPNGVIRVDNVNAVVELQTTDISGSCASALEYWDKVRRERSGSSLDLQSNQVSMPSNVGDQGINTLVANLEQVSALIARNFSETLVHSLYKLVHKFHKKYFEQDLQKKMDGEWVQTNPQQWLSREQINITVPPTKSEKITMQVALEKAIGNASQEMQMGKEGILTTDDNIYQMKQEFMRLSGLDFPGKYLVDPSSPEAQQVKQQNQQKQQQMEQQQQQEMAEAKQAQQQQMTAQLKAQEALTIAQTEEVKRNWENDKDQLMFDYEELEKKMQMDKYIADLKAGADEDKLVAGATTQFELKGMDYMTKMADHAHDKDMMEEKEEKEEKMEPEESYHNK